MNKFIYYAYYTIDCKRRTEAKMVNLVNYLSFIYNGSKSVIKILFYVSLILFLLLLSTAIISSTILGIATLAMEEPGIYVGQIQDGLPYDLGNGEAFNLRYVQDCPEMTLIPFEDTYSILQVTLSTDSKSTESLALSYYLNFDGTTGLYTGLLGTCASRPGQPCSLPLPLHTSRFYAIVDPPRSLVSNSTRFIWYCNFSINPAQICALCFLVVSLTFAIVILLFYFHYFSIWCAKYLEERKDANPFGRDSNYRTPDIPLSAKAEYAIPEFSVTKMSTTLNDTNSQRESSQIKYV